jgi:phage-related protein
MMSAVWDVELEREVDEWLSRLPVTAFATTAFHIDRLAEQGPAVRMPHSKPLGEGLFEVRFYLDRVAQRITYFFAGERRIVLLTEFRKQRMSEQGEIARARTAMARCIREGHTAEEDDR